MSDTDPIPLPRIPTFASSPAAAPKPTAPPTMIKLPSSLHAPTDQSGTSAAAAESGVSAPVLRPKRALPAARRARLPQKEVAFRILVAFGLITSLLLIWYSYSKVLVPAQAQAKDLSTTVSRLSLEVDNMDRKLHGAGAQEINNRVLQVPSSLITTKPELRGWLANLDAEVVPLALDAKADFGAVQVQQTAAQKLALIPTKISLEARPARGIEGIESPYQRVLRLGLRMAEQERRTDVTEIRVTGGPGSVARAEIILNLWAGEGARQK